MEEFAVTDHPPWLGELEHGLLNFHLWRKTGCCHSLSQKLFKAEEKGKNPRPLRIIPKLKSNCLRGKSWMWYVVSACNTDPFLPNYTTPCALLTREAPTY